MEREAPMSGPNAEELKALQAPLKARYRNDPDAAIVTLRAQGDLGGEGLTCSVETGRGPVAAGLHPAAGGDGRTLCSGDMLLQALVACAGVTLRTVATSTGIPVRGGRVVAEGVANARGALGISDDVPVGLTDIRLYFQLETDADHEQVEKLLRLTERYCVIYQTLRSSPTITLSTAVSRQ